MRWTDVAGPILVLVALSGIIRMMVRGDKPSPDKVRTAWLGRILSGASLRGLLAAVALGSALQHGAGGTASPWATGFTSGAIVALAFALLLGTGEWRGLGLNLLSGLLGAVGLTVIVRGFFAPQGLCSPADVGHRVLTFLIVLVALVVGGAMSWGKGFFSLKKLGATVLAVFGALKVVAFLSSPLGVSLVDLGVTAWVVALVAAFALGVAASIWPEFVITIAGVTVAAAGIIGAVNGSGSAQCMPGPDSAGLAPLVGYLAMFIAFRLVVGRRKKANDGTPAA